MCIIIVTQMMAMLFKIQCDFVTEQIEEII